MKKVLTICTALVLMLMMTGILAACKGGGPQTFTVSFNRNANATVTNMPSKITGVEKNATVTEPASIPERTDGYTFSGWYKEAAGTNAWVFETDKVTKNVTLFAKWEEDPEPEDFEPNAVATFTVRSTGFANVTLEWTVPAPNGGTTITKYQVFIDSPAGIFEFDKQWIDLSAGHRSYGFSGVGGGDEWTAKVRAVNAKGPGAEKAITFATWQLNDPEEVFTTAEYDTHGTIGWKNVTDAVAYTVRLQSGGETVASRYLNLANDPATAQTSTYFYYFNSLDGDGNAYYYLNNLFAEFGLAAGTYSVSVRAHGYILGMDGHLYMVSNYSNPKNVIWGGA